MEKIKDGCGREKNEGIRSRSKDQPPTPSLGGLELTPSALFQSLKEGTYNYP